MYSYAPEKSKTAPFVKKEIKNKENQPHGSAMAQFGLNFFRSENSDSYFAQPLRGEGGVCQLLSLAVRGEGGRPLYRGSPYQVKRYKRKGWHLFMGLQSICCELRNDPHGEEITIGQAQELLHKIISTEQAQALPVEIGDLCEQLEEIASGRDPDLPLIQAGDYEEVQGDLGDPSYKSEVLKQLGEMAHKFFTDSGQVCGPHIAISFVGGRLYLAINTPNTREIGKMISAGVLADGVLSAVNELMSQLGPADRLASREMEQYQYLDRLKNAMESGQFSVIETPETPAGVQDHLGTMHAEMLIAEHLKSALAPERTEMVTVAKTWKGEVLQDDFLEPLDTRRRLLERREKASGAVRVIRFGGTLIDCGLCHAKFHGGQTKRGQGGSSLWRGGNKTDEIEENDAYDSFFEEYQSVVLSSERGSRWHPGWRCGPLAMEMGSVEEPVVRERARLRDQRTREAKLYEAMRLSEALQGFLEFNTEEAFERIALLAGSNHELFQHFFTRALESRDTGRLLTAARVLLHTGDMSEEERSGCHRLIFAMLSESERDKEIPEDVYRFFNLVLHNPHQTLWQELFRSQEFVQIAITMVSPAMVQTNFGWILDLIRFLAEHPYIDAADIFDIVQRIISIIEENKETYIKRFCCLISALEKNQECLISLCPRLVDVAEGLLKGSITPYKYEELTALLSVMNLCGLPADIIRSIFIPALVSASSIDDYVDLTQVTLCLQSDLRGPLGGVVGEKFAQFILSNVGPRDYDILLHTLNSLAELPLCEDSMRCIVEAARLILDEKCPVTYQLAFIELLEEVNGKQNEMALFASNILPAVHAAAERLATFDDLLIYMDSVLLFLHKLKSDTGIDCFNEFFGILYQKAVSTQFSEPEGILNIFRLVELLEKYSISWDILHGEIKSILKDIDVFFENYQYFLVALPIILQVPDSEIVFQFLEPAIDCVVRSATFPELIDLTIKILCFKPLELYAESMIVYFKLWVQRMVSEGPKPENAWLYSWLYTLFTSGQLQYGQSLYTQAGILQGFSNATESS